MNEAEFDAATRAAIQASLQEAKDAADKPPDWQAPAVDGKKKRNRKQRYKDNLVRAVAYMLRASLGISTRGMTMRAKGTRHRSCHA